ncbi:YeeE/YedE family protein [Flavobacterium sp. CBA20B-1]|uniref:YeeE/YedE family protein n=1 Tax=Paenimyroides aestuarii TaxID=2968490 RepID=A0ABY5NSQ2_9FLAO|nr:MULTISPECIES: YeeE/YedE family protein [Flavobacteriaceae]UUV21570.1 YeeE/YedE family protein [Paenimyroides aestuarii]WCM42941.1 YeeE/YedE family protein [Flavobacterium sp. CBA20B-1]
MKNVIYLIIGTFFGIVMYKSEAASWFRIYEMFNFQSIHMYGLMGSALAVGIVLVQYIKSKKIKDITGNQITIADKEKSIARYLIGGILFGLGWALAGACPGPMFVLTGAGYFPILIVILGAVLGTWFYGLLKNKLPH